MAINRVSNFSYISERLATLSVMVKSCGRINVLSLHNHSENFYQHFLKVLYGWELVDLNTDQKNEEAIDLVCQEEKMIVQVSATATKIKINNSLDKINISSYRGYRFIFISVAEDAKDLRKKEYTVPKEIAFNPILDIYDITRILSDIKQLNIKKQDEIKDFLYDELGILGQAKALDSNLTKVIDILSKQDLGVVESGITINSFAIDKKIEFNSLLSIKDIIDQYAVYHAKLDRIYTEFDSQGFNKSASILNLIKSEYIKCFKEAKNEELFYLICDKIKSKIINSKNFFDIEEEELEMCLYVIMVDAFVRCKIFENPSDYKYVIA